jgi:pimeloyl-ACP methyl ester carboxylesterase
LDVILLGHSLGGLVAAEVALMASSSTTGHIVSRNLNHRVIGLVNFDAPFLGLHPCVLRTGIGRLLVGKQIPTTKAKKPLKITNSAYTIMIRTSTPPGQMMLTSLAGRAGMEHSILLRSILIIYPVLLFNMCSHTMTMPDV